MTASSAHSARTRTHSERPPCWHDGSCPTPIRCFLSGCQRQSSQRRRFLPTTARTPPRFPQPLTVLRPTTTHTIRMRQRKLRAPTTLTRSPAYKAFAVTNPTRRHMPMRTRMPGEKSLHPHQTRTRRTQRQAPPFVRYVHFRNSKISRKPGGSHTHTLRENRPAGQINSCHTAKWQIGFGTSMGRTTGPVTFGVSADLGGHPPPAFAPWEPPPTHRAAACPPRPACPAAPMATRSQTGSRAANPLTTCNASLRVWERGIIARLST